MSRHVLSPLGKFIRKKRIELDIRLFDLANKLDISTSYLCAIENGQKNINDKFINKLISVLNLNSNEKKELNNLIEISNPKLKINLQNQKDSIRELSFEFFNKIKNLSDEQIKKIMAVMQGEL